MPQENLRSRHGYAIPCRWDWQGEQQVVIVCHGFGSSKDSPMAQMVAAALPPLGMGVVRFDFPAHGDSPVWQEGLRVPFCIDDLETVEQAIWAQAPQTKICYFASSFGAYITLLRLARDPRPDARAFLRAAAVTMPDLVDSWLDDRARADLDRQGYFVPDYDYVREMRVTRDFLQDLAQGNVFAQWRQDLAQLAMVHGTLDAVVPVAGPRRFAQTFGAALTELPQGEHPLMGEGEAQQVLDLAKAFFQTP